MNTKFFSIFIFGLIINHGAQAETASSDHIQRIIKSAQKVRTISVCNDIEKAYNSKANDEENIKRIVIEGANSGIAICEFQLGSWYESGTILEKNLGTARDFYQRAATQNSTAALMALGRFYENGLGVPKDYRKAADFYRKAAARFDETAWVSLTRIQAAEDVLTPEEIAADRQLWLRFFIAKSAQKIRSAPDLWQDTKDDTEKYIVIIYTLKPDDKEPTIAIKESSGDTSFDMLVLRTISSVKIPDPIYSGTAKDQVFIQPFRLKK